MKVRSFRGLVTKRRGSLQRKGSLSPYPSSPRKNKQLSFTVQRGTHWKGKCFPSPKFNFNTFFPWLVNAQKYNFLWDLYFLGANSEKQRWQLTGDRGVLCNAVSIWHDPRLNHKANTEWCTVQSAQSLNVILNIFTSHQTCFLKVFSHRNVQGAPPTVSFIQKKKV